MKKIIIFESVKGAGKTILTNELKKHLKNSIILDENITLKPIKHNIDKKIDENEYLNIINNIESSNFAFYLLDRFHYTKWSCINYDKKYFEGIENLLLNKFKVYFIFLKIDNKYLLLRLKETQEHRAPSGWKLNYDKINIDEEAEKDIGWQNFILDNQFKDSKIKNKLVLDTTNLNKSLNNLDKYIQQILNFILDK